MKHHCLKKWNFTVTWRIVNMEDITDTDYNHAKRVYKDFEIKM